MGPAISSSLRWNYWRSGRLWSPRPGSISCAATGSWPLVPETANRIVPTQPVAESTAADRAPSAPPCGHRLGWAALLARGLATDLSACPAGGGRQRIIAALTDPASIRRYLVGVGLPPKAPPRAPPHTPVRVRRLTSSAMGAGEPYGERRPQWSQRGPGWTRYGPTGNPTLLRALANDLQTIISELPLPLAWVRRLDKRAQKVPHFSYTSTDFSATGDTRAPVRMPSLAATIWTSGPAI